VLMRTKRGDNSRRTMSALCKACKPGDLPHDGRNVGADT
jgi:hypothetical protein